MDLKSEVCLMMRVYIDTSVVGGCFDDEFSEESCALFEMAKSGKISFLISNILADELTIAPERVQNVVVDLPRNSFEIVQESDESHRLRDRYLAAGVVSVPPMSTMPITWPSLRCQVPI
jgi:hypothetical protein